MRGTQNFIQDVKVNAKPFNIVFHRGKTKIDEMNVLAVDQNLAGRRKFKTGNHPERRRLAAARRPQQHKELAVFDRERRRLDGGDQRPLVVGPV